MDRVTLLLLSMNRYSASKSIPAQKVLPSDSLRDNTVEYRVLCGNLPSRLLPFDSHPSHSPGPESRKVR